MTDEVSSAADVAALLVKHRLDLYAFLRAAVRNHHDAEDLMQEVALAAARSAADYAPGTDFLAWVREIARRRVLEYARSGARRSPLLEPAVLESLGAASASVAAAKPAGPRVEALKTCLETLDGPSRQVLDLRYAGAHQVPSIAEKCGRSVQGVYALLKRARLALRECVERRTAGGLT